MKVFIDFEFMEDGKTIIPLSLGATREDGGTFYREFEADLTLANDWVEANVLPHLTGDTTPVEQIRDEFLAFVGPSPEFWGYYADYDWVLLCQMYGRMVDLPEGWPMFCMDIKQWAVHLGNPRLPAQEGPEHHALADSGWNQIAHQFLEAYALEHGGVTA